MPSKSVIIKEGELPKALFIIYSGLINFYRTLRIRPDPDTPGQLLQTRRPLEHPAFGSQCFSNINVGEFSIGHSFPLAELFLSQPCSYTAINTGPCQLLVVSYADIKAYLGEDYLKDIERQVKRADTDIELKQKLANDMIWAGFKARVFREEEFYTRKRVLSPRKPILPKPAPLAFEFYDPEKIPPRKGK